MIRLKKVLDKKIAAQIEAHRDLMDKMREYIEADDELSSFSKKFSELQDSDEKITQFLDFEDEEDKEDEPTHQEIFEAVAEFLKDTLKDDKGVNSFLKSMDKFREQCEANCPCKKG